MLSADAAWRFASETTIVTNVQDNSLTIVVKNITDDQGTIRVGLFNAAKEFPMGKVFKGGIGSITNRTATVKFDSLAAGEYAAAILHDKNNNKKMDYNFMGIPIEGYGFSNNAKAILSAPSFDAAKVTLAPHTQLTITVSLQ